MSSRPFRIEDGNESVCGACLKSGTLICCENCPASFHPECAGYRNVDSVPEGDWFCFLCARKLGRPFDAGKGYRRAVGDVVMVACDEHGEVFEKGVVVGVGEQHIKVRKGHRCTSYALDDPRLWNGTLSEESWTHTPENDYRPNSRAFEIDYQQLASVDEPPLEQNVIPPEETYSQFLARKKSEPREKHFVELLRHFYKVKMGMDDIQWPAVGYVVCLSDLWDAVEKQGGFFTVNDRGLWNTVEQSVIPESKWRDLALLLKHTFQTVLLEVESNGGVEAMESLFKCAPAPQKKLGKRGETEHPQDAAPKKRRRRERSRKKSQLPTANDWVSMADNAAPNDDVLTTSGSRPARTWPQVFSASRAVQEYRTAIGIVALTETAKSLRTGDKVDVRVYKDSSLGPWRSARILTIATASAFEGYRRFRVKFSKSKDPAQFPNIPETWVTFLARPTAWGTTLAEPSVLVRSPMKPSFPPVKSSIAASHSVGDRVEAWLHNGWWPASILSIQDDQALLQGDVIPLGEGLKWISSLLYVRTAATNEKEGYGMIEPLSLDEKIYPKEMEKKLKVTVDKTTDGHLVLCFKRLDDRPLRSADDEEEKVSQERNVSSVFPTESQILQSREGQGAEESVKSRFISETQLNEARESGLAKRDANPHDGKSLAVILAENKQKKEEAFQEHWKTMKQGKNRPLDQDEYEFVDAVYKQEAQKAKEQYDHGQRDVEEFKKARADAFKKETMRPVVPLKKKKRSGLAARVNAKVVPKKRGAPKADRMTTTVDRQKRRTDSSGAL